MTSRGRGAANHIPDLADDRGGAYDDGTRRTEILQTAASLIASSGLRTSLQEIVSRVPPLGVNALIKEGLLSAGRRRSYGR